MPTSSARGSFLLTSQVSGQGYRASAWTGCTLTNAGLRDINSARRQITERYILECDEIFVVCGQDRATTNEGVKAVIELANPAKLSNVGIICTKSDVSHSVKPPCLWLLQRSPLTTGPGYPSRGGRAGLAGRTGQAGQRTAGGNHSSERRPPAAQG
jgi:hypothetical protein